LGKAGFMSVHDYRPLEPLLHLSLSSPSSYFLTHRDPYQRLDFHETVIVKEDENLYPKTLPNTQCGYFVTILSETTDARE
jgi:hypothetical protein